MVYGLELVPEFGEVDGAVVLLQLTTLHLYERQILQVHASAIRQRQTILHSKRWVVKFKKVKHLQQEITRTVHSIL